MRPVICASRDSDVKSSIRLGHLARSDSIAPNWPAPQRCRPHYPHRECQRRNEDCCRLMSQQPVTKFTKTSVGTRRWIEKSGIY